MISEQHIKFAAKLYQARDAMKGLYGDGYRERIDQYIELIEKVRSEKKQDVLEAAIDICAGIENGGFKSGVMQALTLAAAVEILEHSAG